MSWIILNLFAKCMNYNKFWEISLKKHGSSFLLVSSKFKTQMGSTNWYTCIKERNSHSKGFLPLTQSISLLYDWGIGVWLELKTAFNSCRLSPLHKKCNTIHNCFLTSLSFFHCRHMRHIGSHSSQTVQPKCSTLLGQNLRNYLRRDPYGYLLRYFTYKKLFWWHLDCHAFLSITFTFCCYSRTVEVHNCCSRRGEKHSTTSRVSPYTSFVP